MCRFVPWCALLYTLACATPATTSRKAAEVLGGLAAPQGAYTRTDATARGPTRETSTCHPDCASGFACDEGTATCKPIPCGGKCRFDQVCNNTGVVEYCAAIPR